MSMPENPWENLANYLLFGEPKDIEPSELAILYCAVGYLYHRGEQLPQNNTRAMRCFIAAANNGHPTARQILPILSAQSRPSLR